MTCASSTSLPLTATILRRAGSIVSRSFPACEARRTRSHSRIRLGGWQSQGRLIQVALPFQITFRRATEADFAALADVMFAAVGERDSPYTEAQRQVWVPEPAAAGVLAFGRR